MLSITAELCVANTKIVSIICLKLPDDGMNNDPDGLRTRHEGAS